MPDSQRISSVHLEMAEDYEPSDRLRDALRELATALHDEGRGTVGNVEVEGFALPKGGVAGGLEMGSFARPKLGQPPERGFFACLGYGTGGCEMNCTAFINTND